MNDIVRAYDGLPWLVKLILALPGIDGIAWGLYRVFKGLAKKRQHACFNWYSLDFLRDFHLMDY